MEKSFPSKRPKFSNFLLIGIFVVSLVVYWYISVIEPELTFIMLLVFIDFPIIGYILIINNTIKFEITKKTLKATWFSGSHEINLENIIGYYEYKLPLFEIHFEVNFLGGKLKRNEIGEFYYLSPGIRKGLIIEYNQSNSFEKIFIVPKNKDDFIDTLRFNLIDNYTRKIDEFNQKFYVK
jgi:hypothetical protein